MSNFLRDYDAAVVARFAPATVTVDGMPVLQVTVPGITAPVVLGVGLPEEWFEQFTLPYISLTRETLMVDHKRVQPTWRGTEVDGDTVHTQAQSPVPVSIPYVVDLAAQKAGDMNALTAFLLLTALPPYGFGTAVTVNGRVYGYHATTNSDKTKFATKDGRVFRHAYGYAVEGWIYTVECVDTPAIESVLLTLEAYATSVTPTPDQATALEVATFTIPVTE
jgi:hypothetical protein